MVYSDPATTRNIFYLNMKLLLLCSQPLTRWCAAMNGGQLLAKRCLNPKHLRHCVVSQQINHCEPSMDINIFSTLLHALNTHSQPKLRVKNYWMTLCPNSGALYLKTLYSFRIEADSKLINNIFFGRRQQKMTDHEVAGDSKFIWNCHLTNSFRRCSRWRIEEKNLKKFNLYLLGDFFFTSFCVCREWKTDTAGVNHKSWGTRQRRPNKKYFPNRCHIFHFNKKEPLFEWKADSFSQRAACAMHIQNSRKNAINRNFFDHFGRLSMRFWFHKWTWTCALYPFSSFIPFVRRDCFRLR